MNRYRQKPRRRPAPPNVRYKIPLGLRAWARGAKRGSRFLIMQLQSMTKLDLLRMKVH